MGWSESACRRRRHTSKRRIKKLWLFNRYNNNERWTAARDIRERFLLMTKHSRRIRPRLFHSSLHIQADFFSSFRQWIFAVCSAHKKNWDFFNSTLQAIKTLRYGLKSLWASALTWVFEWRWDLRGFFFSTQLTLLVETSWMETRADFTNSIYYSLLISGKSCGRRWSAMAMK